MAELTEAVIRRAIAGSKAPRVLWDDRPKGLGLRLRASGARSWIFVFRPRGAGRGVASRTITIGRWSDVTLASARLAARRLAGEVAAGRDPAAEARDRKTAESRLISNVIDNYVAALERRRIVNARVIASTLRRGLERLKSKDIQTATRADFVREFDKLDALGKPGAAADLRKHCRTMVEWAVSKGLLPFNPLAGLRRPRASRAERLEAEQKGRALDDAEIIAVWNAAERFDSFGGLVRLALLTGLRRGELRALTWSDIGTDRIAIAAHVAKTGERHEIPLTRAMRAVLNAQSRSTSPFVFTSWRRHAPTPLSGWSPMVARLQAASGVRFALHDLRRTCRTLMSRLGVDEYTAERAIGHKRKGLIAVYNMDDAWGARRDGFDRVSEHVAGLLTGPPAADNVALLARSVPG